MRSKTSWRGMVSAVLGILILCIGTVGVLSRPTREERAEAESARSIIFDAPFIGTWCQSNTMHRVSDSSDAVEPDRGETIQLDLSQNGSGVEYVYALSDRMKWDRMVSRCPFRWTALPDHTISLGKDVRQYRLFRWQIEEGKLILTSSDQMLVFDRR